MDSLSEWLYDNYPFQYGKLGFEYDFVSKMEFYVRSGSMYLLIDCFLMKVVIFVIDGDSPSIKANFYPNAIRNWHHLIF